MTVYKRPGVYINETLTPIAQAVSTPGQSIAAFVGTNKAGGPVTPTLVSSFQQFVSVYGGFGDNSDLLPFAVYQFFNNGGNQAYIQRAVASDAVAASVSLMDTEETPQATLKISAISPGTWGNQVYVDIVAGSTGSGRFDLVIYVGGDTAAFVKERFNDISLDPSDSRNAQALINSPEIGSAYIHVQSLLNTAWDVSHAPVVQAGTPLTGGSEGAAAVNLVAAAESLEVIEDNLILNLPGITDATTLNPILTWAENQGSVFVVIDGVKPAATDNAHSYAVSLQGMSTGGSAIADTSYGAIYGPWLIVNDPATAAQGSARLLPPGGAVVGQYTRTDASRGVQKPPAGIDTVLRGVLDVQFRFSNDDQDNLNVAGINVLKSLPGTGFVIYGARTLSAGMPDRYVSVRRSLMLIKKGVLDATRFAVFEPNDQILWDQVSAVISQYLLTLMQTGVLAGSTPDQAFFVTCDATNNTPATVSQGIVNITVGVALQTPAEFIVINIGQSGGGSTTTETDNS
ncbi:phage tail sheath subtilisin-like domain-containing protein [Streptomyces sp. MI02-2A]|uniref:phage tail sheath family protein n=1 Tax=Streptomyces sp. MI02-2A TaxID=3028688 RepID=UPI0029A1F16B|nr:phage tail sheath subtilisin-like domain-containing protein [Streptomyces sp. MI02-2A]MDX3260696.1 phage tail sheath subtilisin-like domain-containing protein [Streptomyces sp. MI02-2A]